jgi:hypothetical protein
MPDTVPKPAALKRRRNVDPSAAKFVGVRAEKPSLPEGFLPATVEWWNAIWDSPMASIWLASDAPELLVMARLQDRVNAGDFSATLLGELRQLKDRFGLSPLARRRLAWEVSQAADVDDAAVAVEEDDGRWLRAVSG